MSKTLRNKTLSALAAGLAATVASVWAGRTGGRTSSDDGAGRWCSRRRQLRWIRRCCR